MSDLKLAWAPVTKTAGRGPIFNAYKAGLEQARREHGQTAPEEWPPFDTEAELLREWSNFLKKVRLVGKLGPNDISELEQIEVALRRPASALGWQRAVETLR